MSSAPQDASNDENARYKRAIRAAEELFKKVGFRGVTMELVAREADVAKGTLYSYFKNKDELFLAVCARMARIEQRAVEQALSKPAPLDSRLADAIIAKHRTIFTLVRGSAHAAELFSYTHNMAGDIFGALDAAILKTLQETIAQDPVLAPQAQRLARALYFGSAELAARSETLADMEAELTTFATTHLAGVRVLAKTNASAPLPLIKTPP